MKKTAAMAQAAVQISIAPAPGSPASTAGIVGM
jgi:hypothetical protein